MRKYKAMVPTTDEWKQEKVDFVNFKGKENRYK
jgi:hypothetical protein